MHTTRHPGLTITNALYNSPIVSNELATHRTFRSIPCQKFGADQSVN